MSHGSITHPDRGTLTFRQGQLDEDPREAVANITAELGTDRPPLVHTETRERDRHIRGRVTSPRRAQDDPDTGDWRQALANYVDRLEAHVDEFQGEGYQFEDAQTGESLRGVLERVEWTLTQGSPFEIEYDAQYVIGRGTMDARSISERDPVVQAGMSVAARVDGVDLPGLRELRVQRSIGVNPKAVYNRSSAENNDIVGEDGVQHEITFEGTHTGSETARASADAALDDLVATKNPVVFETRFPGYSLDGFVLGYESDREQRHGGRSHQYSLRFMEGTRA